MVEVPEILDLLKAGAHFGHQKSKWHPKMAPFIFGVRNGVRIIDLETTRKKLAEALDFLKQAASEGKIILFLGTKEQAKEIIKRHAEAAGCPYVKERWLGGMLTNHGEIQNLLRKYRRLKADQTSGALAKYTKQEQNKFNKEIIKLDKFLSGLAGLERRPDVIFIVDLKKEKTAVNEAKITGTIMVGIADTNVNPEGIAYPVPANDDATKSIDLLVGLASQAVLEGRAMAREKTETAPAVAPVVVPQPQAA